MKVNEFELYRRDPDTVAAIIFNNVLANKLNKVLNIYPGYKIRKGEEAVFFITEHNMDLFLAQLPKRIHRPTLVDFIQNGGNNEGE